MTVRGQLEPCVLQRLEEAEGYLKGMRDERLRLDHPRFLEWGSGVELLFWFSFGELSSHYRTWQAVLKAEGTPHVFYGRLAGCLHRARRVLAKSGLNNPLLAVPEWLTLPSFALSRNFIRQAHLEKARWELFFTTCALERWKL